MKTYCRMGVFALVSLLSVSIVGWAQIDPVVPLLTQLRQSGNRHQHEAGFSFQYPADWQLQKTEDGLSLLPPNANGDAYVVITEKAEGVTEPDDPQLVRVLHEQITQIAPFLKLLEETEKVKTCSLPNTLLTWEGRNPLGVDMRARVGIALAGDNLVYLLASGSEDGIAQRDLMFQAILSTFQMGEQAAPNATDSPSGVTNPLAVSNPLVPTDPFVGTYKNDQLTVELKKEQGKYTGTIQLGGQTFPLTALPEGDSLSGTFQSLGQTFGFNAALNGNTLNFVTDGFTHQLEKQTPVNPLAAAPIRPAAPANPLASIGSATPTPDTSVVGKLQNGQTFRHSTGFLFQYPTTWKAEDTELGVQLIPPDLASNAQGPTEVYLVVGESAEGISQVDDPAIGNYFDQQLGQMMPFLKCTGETQHLKAGTNEGVVLSWEGKNPTGMQIKGRIFVTLLKGYAIALVGLGDAPRINARKQILDQIAATFEFGQPQMDSKLVGSWRYESIYMSGEFSSTTVRYMTLRPDGTFLWGSRLLASMSHYDSGGSLTGSSSADSGAKPDERGRWNGADKKLTLTWDDGSYAVYTYYVQGEIGAREMLLKPVNGGKNQLWQERR